MVSLLSDVRPLKEYLADKKEMIEVMFSCIEENQLKKMIPDVLKDAKMEDIKAECLVELLGMSKKRIIGLMEGKELDESSEDSLELSDISDDEDTNIKAERESPEKYSSKKKESRETKSKGNRKVTKFSSSDSDRDEEPAPSKKKKARNKKKEDSPAKEPPAKKAKNQAGKKTKGETSKETKEDNSASDVELSLEIPEEKKGGKNLLEILELEMRARAIRSLIEREEKKNNEPKPSTSNQNIPDPDLDLIDNDPDAVIIIDEAADQIDLTKDESDSEEQTKKKKEKLISEKPTTSQQPRIYRSNTQKSPEHTDNSTLNQRTKTTENKDDSETNSKNDTDPNQANKDKTNEAFVPRNWTERWLDSNDVKKVMKTTKVLTNLKKRLINVNKQKNLEEKMKEETVKEPTVIEGTVSEYSQLQQKITDGDDQGSNTQPSDNDNIPNQSDVSTNEISINQTDKECTTQSDQGSINQSDSTDQPTNIESELLPVETFISKIEMNVIMEGSESTSAIKTLSETAELSEPSTDEKTNEEIEDRGESVADEVISESNDKSNLVQDCEHISSESVKDTDIEMDN